jgi:hypothetical protein
MPSRIPPNPKPVVAWAFGGALFAFFVAMWFSFLEPIRVTETDR